MSEVSKHLTCESLVEIAFQCTGADRVLQLLQRPDFDLPNPLARHFELLAELLERTSFIAVDTEPHLDDLSLPHAELIENSVNSHFQ